MSQTKTKKNSKSNYEPLRNSRIRFVGIQSRHRIGCMGQGSYQSTIHHLVRLDGTCPEGWLVQKEFLLSRHQLRDWTRTSHSPDSPRMYYTRFQRTKKEEILELGILTNSTARSSHFHDQRFDKYQPTNSPKP